MTAAGQVPAPQRAESAGRGDALAVGAVALAAVALHLVCITQYGYFRDELYYLACARHLGWGYVDHPPFSIFVLWLVTKLFGDSIFAIRIVPVLTSGALVFMTGWFARELGARRGGQVLVAIAAAAAPVMLGVTSFFSMNAFEAPMWLGAAWVVARILRTGDERLWIAFGAIAGAGLENKHSMLFLGFGIAAGLVLTPARRYLRSRWFWAGGALAIALWLPNLIWEIRYGWPTLEFMHNAQLHKNYHAPAGEFLIGQILLAQPLTLPVWLAGVWYFFSADRGRYRALGWTYIVILAVFIVQGAKGYYLSPVYPMLFAAGGAQLDALLRAAAPRRTEAAYAALIAAGGLVTAPLALPLLPPQALFAYMNAFPIPTRVKAERHETGWMPQLFADRFGWHSMAATVAAVYNSMPQREKSSTAIFASNYGEAGAIDFFGPAMGLPHAVSGHNSYYLWGPPPDDPRTVIAIGEPRRVLSQVCAEVTQAAATHCEYCMPDENGAPVFVCRGLKKSLRDLWPMTKNYD
jgi:4-amino-4-deoxy-L-arabinose transferase-like glycosyltransferase